MQLSALDVLSISGYQAAALEIELHLGSTADGLDMPGTIRFRADLYDEIMVSISEFGL